MLWHASPNIAFSAKHKKALADTSIDFEGGPGTILHDFEVLLNYIREHDFLQLTAAQQLPMRSLGEINERLTRPLQLGLDRPLQKSYPHIHGLYLLARASGLTGVDEGGRKPLLFVDEAMYKTWQSLNPTERYGALLESWLLRGKPQIIGERGRPFYPIPENLEKWMHFFVLKIPDQGLQIAGNSDAEDGLPYTPGWYNLGLLELFGLIVVEHGASEPGKGWRIERISRTPLGDALLALLHNKVFGDLDSIRVLMNEDQVPSGVLRPILQPYFPEWQREMSLPEWTFREGTHIFKVSLGRLWRRIAIPADQSMDSLAYAILKAVDFDDDHLYRFSYQDRFGAEAVINHPYLDEGPRTSEVLVGDLPLRIGQKMIYLFDFGDHWEFDVTLEQVDADMDVKKPVLLESRGKSPEQYPVWDEWE